MRNRGSTAKRLLKFITGISLMTLCAATSVFALPPNTEFLPTFEKEVLTPVSQAASAWQNVAPNALASYYTYQPLTNADAVAAGFPAACDVAPAGSFDCYIISARQVVQPMSLDFLKLVGIPGFPGPGLIQGDGLTPFVNTTDVPSVLADAAAGKLTTSWGYGSGGLGWKPYGAAGPTLSRGNAPAAFQNVPISLFTTNTFGDPAPTGVWHFPAPTIKGTTNRPVLVLWMNELPNVKPVGHDPSVDCGDNAQFCYPYNRIVTHVHGAHVGPESDGLAVAWYTPNFALYGEGQFTGAAPPTGNLYKVAAIPSIPTQFHNAPIYYYPMSQEAGTIWYHDHAVGTTHNNTDMGMAGFFPVTDAVEKALQTPTAADPLANPPVLAAPAVLPAGDFELGFALQDRHFDVTGQMVMPAAAIYDKNDPNCIFDADNNALPGTCKRLDWMKKINPLATDPNRAPYLVPYDATTLAGWATSDPDSYALNFPGGKKSATNKNGCQVNLTNTFEGIAGVDPVLGTRVSFTQCAPFPATSATLEYFGNMPVVNGVTYAVYDVEPTVYRMRFIGGTDSRTWIAQLIKGNPTPTMNTCGGGTAPNGCAVYNTLDIVPFFQIGSEQGLLTNMVERSEIDIMGGERYDVLVDFTSLAGQTITMKNLGDDAPYSGRFDFDDINLRQPTSVLIPEIMKFRVKAAAVPASAATPAAGTILKGAYPAVFPTNTRTIALIEITDQYGRTMPTIDSRGYIPPGIRTTEVIGLNAQGEAHEQWDIVNTTVDAHPMHLHQVAFQAINRQAIALDVDGAPLPSGFRAGDNHTFGAEANHDFSLAARQASVFSPSQYLVAPGSSPIPVADYDAGLKDTIQTPPGYVVRVKAIFDIVGDYVWHCHILSHEEHDMMRPFRVTNAAALTAPDSVTVGAVDASGLVQVTVLPVQTAPIQHVVQYRKLNTPFWITNAASTTVQAINLPAGDIGTYEFRAQFVEPAIQNVHANTHPDSAFTDGNQVGYGLTLLSINPMTLPAFTIGSGSYAGATFTAAGGIGPFAWAATLPAGLVLDPATGVLSGVPATTVPGTIPFNVSVTDNGQNPPVTVSMPFSFVASFPALAITPATLADGVSGTLYAPVTLAATGGNGTYVWSADPLTLPAGLSFSAGGVLSGTPTAAGSFTFNLLVADTQSPAFTASQSFTLAVAYPALAITPATLANGVVGAPYTPVTLVATGGNGTYTWSADPLTLPAGLVLSSAGVLSGTPTAAGPFTFTVQVADTQATPFTSTQSFSVVVDPQPVVADPASITVPATSTTGAYSVSWGASATPGATYVLQESTDPLFGTFTETVGAVSPVAYTGKTNGTYYYRVKAVNAPLMVDSAWVGAANGIVVSVTVGSPNFTYVASTNSTGNYSVSWGVSATTGVTYVLEESSDINFITTIEVYRGNANQVSLTAKPTGTYFYRVKAIKAGMNDSAWVASPNSINVTLTSGTPFWAYVATSSATGSYSVAWGASATAGVTFVVEESTNAGFTTSTEVYRGIANQVNLSGRLLGTYYYRVKAIKTGYLDSAWTVAPNGISVTVTTGTPNWANVATSSTTGSYSVGWGPSATAGVTFVVEESTNAGFTTSTEVYRGIANQVNLSGRLLGTYYYRVKAIKTGYLDSAWTVAPNGISVTVTAGTPYWVYVATSSATGNFGVAWGASATAGVTFVVEESSDAGFITSTEVYRGIANQVNLRGRLLGTYYYRVKAIKTGYLDSAWRLSPNGITVP